MQHLRPRDGVDGVLRDHLALRPHRQGLGAEPHLHHLPGELRTGRQPLQHPVKGDKPIAGDTPVFEGKALPGEARG